MTDEEIVADRAIIDTATGGEWCWDFVYPFRVLAEGHTILCAEDINDARFVANARTRWPVALAEVERLRAEVLALRQGMLDRLEVQRFETDFQARVLELLRAENARLRAGLERIAAMGGGRERVWARQALAEEEVQG